MTRQRFFDFDGNPIALEEWGRRYEDYQGRILAEDWIGPQRLVTLWLGFVDPGLTGARLFGTAVLRGGNVTELEVYDTKQEAADGHARHLAALRRAE